MKCIVCDKPVVGQSNICSTSCLLRAGSPGGGKRKGRAAVGIVNDAFAASLTGRSDPWKDVPMIVVKHRWMKNRNQRFGNTNLSFNNEGIAHVADVGNARLDVEGYVRHSKGLAEIIDPTATKAPEPPKPPKPPKPLEPEPPKEEEAVVEIMEDLEPEEVVEVLEKKPKKDTKKPPGKKSSSNKKK